MGRYRGGQVQGGVGQVQGAPAPDHYCAVRDHADKAAAGRRHRRLGVADAHHAAFLYSTRTRGATYPYDLVLDIQSVLIEQCVICEVAVKGGSGGGRGHEIQIQHQRSNPQLCI